MKKVVVECLQRSSCLRYSAIKRDNRIYHCIADTQMLVQFSLGSREPVCAQFYHHEFIFLSTVKTCENGFEGTSWPL